MKLARPVRVPKTVSLAVSFGLILCFALCVNDLIVGVVLGHCIIKRRRRLFLAVKARTSLDRQEASLTSQSRRRWRLSRVLGYSRLGIRILAHRVIDQPYARTVKAKTVSTEESNG